MRPRLSSTPCVPAAGRRDPRAGWCAWCRTSTRATRTRRGRAGGRADEPALGAPNETAARLALFSAMPATGAHELIINAPDSVNSLAELQLEQVKRAMEVWRERMREHSASAYVQLIVNERYEAGASLPHTHAQLYALDFVPAAVARERERFRAYANRTMGENLLGNLVAEEVRRRERIVAIDDEAVLIAPYASCSPTS